MFAAIGIWRFCQGLREKPAEINLQSITICVTKNDRNSTTRWYVSACWASNHGGISSEEFTTMSNAVMVKPLRLRSRRSVRPLYLAWNFTKNRAICSRRVEWYCLIFCWVLGSRNVQKCLFLWRQLPCPNQSHPLSLQRVPHWKCSKTGDHSRRRWENSAGWWSGRHPSCQCQGYQPIPNASELVGFKNFGWGSKMESCDHLPGIVQAWLGLLVNTNRIKSIPFPGDPETGQFWEANKVTMVPC